MKENILIVLMIGFGIMFLYSAEKTIKVSGSTSVTPIISKAAEVYKKIYPDVRVLISPNGSGAGIQALGTGPADIAMVSRELDPVEKQKYATLQFQVITIAKDAVVPVVSAQVYEKISALYLEEIRKIYSGEITNWKDLGGPNNEILVIDKEASRGTRHVFMQAVFGNEKAKALGVKLVTGSNNEEQTAVAQSHSAIGMLSNAWLNDQVKGVAIKKNGKVIQPSLENVRNGSFPISRNLNLVTCGFPVGESKKFIDFILSAQGQKIVEELEYVSSSSVQRNNR